MINLWHLTISLMTARLLEHRLYTSNIQFPLSSDCLIFVLQTSMLCTLGQWYSRDSVLVDYHRWPMSYSPMTMSLSEVDEADGP